ncbi:GNAT family N-acetyltransferase [Cohnella sp. CFH 77786]|uniref:GNAT family N-acetyltransferase n=1 Tax=Cohnella sp. CFH 77786 TaxID=2662265 RepID=UPI001C610083|nr:GNAT family N-acetyltransferase [Cohnella sp. CFH 77786]MBW5448362.1 GNAT family N-acetyltransferase [Cohnella sp. CFH 77786]
MTDAKSKYRELCLSNPEIPLINRDWWLDATVGEDGWDVLLVERGGEIIASLPYHRTKKMLFDVIDMPYLTLTMGIWIRYPPGQKYATRLSYEKEIYLELIEKLPKVDYYYQHFHWSITNWSTFYWRGFRQTTRYTYLLENLKDLDRLYANMKEKTRNEIRKAEKQLEVVESDDIETFHRINEMTFKRQGEKMPHSLDFIRRVDLACRERGCRKIWFAKDREGRIHGAVYLAWDEKCAYYLLGGGDPELRKSGASSLLLWEAVKRLSSVTENLDLYGGMHEPVETFFRSFGATQKPYFQISKINGKLFKFAYYLKQAIGQLAAVVATMVLCSNFAQGMMV